MVKVLIAEDDIVIGEMLQDFLIEAGYDVCGIARTVAEGVELGQRHQPDLAVLDLRLSEGGLGTEIAAQLGRRGKLGVLYATANAKHIALTRADGEASISKPYGGDELVRALKIVEQIISTGVALPPFPRGFQMLGHSGSGDVMNDSRHG